MTEASRARGSYARSTSTKRRILAAAMEIATETGFANVSVAQVAARAGVAVGNLNYHFGTKASLIAELMQDRQEDFVSRLSPPSDADNFFSYEMSLLKAYLEFLHSEPSYIRLAEEIRYLDPVLYAAGIQSHIEEIERRILCAVEAGDIEPLDSAAVRVRAYLIQGAYSFLDRLIEDAAYPGDEAALCGIEQFLSHGLNRLN